MPDADTVWLTPFEEIDTLLERAGLEQRACECYAAVRTEYERLLPAPPVMPATAGSRREGRS